MKVQSKSESIFNTEAHPLLFPGIPYSTKHDFQYYSSLAFTLVVTSFAGIKAGVCFGAIPYQPHVCRAGQPPTTTNQHCRPLLSKISYPNNLLVTFACVLTFSRKYLLLPITSITCNTLYAFDHPGQRLFCGKFLFVSAISKEMV